MKTYLLDKKSYCEYPTFPNTFLYTNNKPTKKHQSLWSSFYQIKKWFPLAMVKDDDRVSLLWFLSVQLLITPLRLVVQDSVEVSWWFDLDFHTKWWTSFVLYRVWNFVPFGHLGTYYRALFFFINYFSLFIFIVVKCTEVIKWATAVCSSLVLNILNVVKTVIATQLHNSLSYRTWTLCLLTLPHSHLPSAPGSHHSAFCVCVLLRIKAKASWTC